MNSFFSCLSLLLSNCLMVKHELFSYFLKFFPWFLHNHLQYSKLVTCKSTNKETLLSFLMRTTLPGQVIDEFQIFLIMNRRLLLPAAFFHLNSEHKPQQHEAQLK